MVWYVHSYVVNQFICFNIAVLHLNIQLKSILYNVNNYDNYMTKDQKNLQLVWHSHN